MRSRAVFCLASRLLADLERPSVEEGALGSGFSVPTSLHSSQHLRNATEEYLQACDTSSEVLADGHMDRLSPRSCYNTLAASICRVAVHGGE